MNKDQSNTITKGIPISAKVTEVPIDQILQDKSFNAGKRIRNIKVEFQFVATAPTSTSAVYPWILNNFALPDKNMVLRTIKSVCFKTSATQLTWLDHMVAFVTVLLAEPQNPGFAVQPGAFGTSTINAIQNRNSFVFLTGSEPVIATPPFLLPQSGWALQIDLFNAVVISIGDKIDVDIDMQFEVQDAGH